MSLVNYVIKRGISTTAVCYGKRNFRKFMVPNKRGTREFKRRMREDPYPDYPIDKRGTRDIGYVDGDKFVVVPEMVPDIIVPDLNDFKLKPYVSYRTLDVTQSEFTPEDLFNVVYAPKIKKDFEAKKLNPDGSPMEPSEEEKLTPEEAKNNARKTGTDLFPA